MRAMKKYGSMLMVSILISSCYTAQVIPVDQMEPGKVNLSEKVRKVSLISRNFKFDIDTLGQYFNFNTRLRKAPEKENKGIDSIAVTACFDTLRQVLLGSGRFDEIVVYPYSDINPNKGKNVLQLSPLNIKKLCDENKTDAVFSLEMLSYFYSLNSANPNYGIPKSADVKITAIWAVYVPGKANPVNRFKYSDVINWTGSRESVEKKKSDVPSRLTAIKQACEIAAKNYGRLLAPYWSKSERMVVGLNGMEWDKAIILAQKYKWDSAERIWSSYAESNNNRVKGAAALDLAVAREMQGDYDKAEQWSDQALKLLPGGELRRFAHDYSDILKERRIEIDKLNRLIK
jgi:hypothetical protein